MSCHTQNVMSYAVMLLFKYFFNSTIYIKGNPIPNFMKCTLKLVQKITNQLKIIWWSLTFWSYWYIENTPDEKNKIKDTFEGKWNQ